MAEPDLILVGASARAAAFSAIRAGLSPLCLDLFADADLRARCRVQRVAASDYPKQVPRILNHFPSAPWMYLGGWENRPKLIAAISRRRPLWGNTAQAVRAVRDPHRLTAAWQKAGVPHPRIADRPNVGLWLIKPRDGAGGYGIRPWSVGQPAISHRSICQEFIAGDSCSAVFVGDGGKARLLGVTRQLVGEPWLRANPFQYCGSVSRIAWLPQVTRCFEQIGDVLVREFQLRGLFGVDAIIRDQVPIPVEVNPRYTASIEVLEYSIGMAAMAMHRDVFTGVAPSVPSTEAATIVGKAILFAAQDLVFPDDGPWTGTLALESPWGQVPPFADIPAAGSRIDASWPILTLFAQGYSEDAVYSRLQSAAADIERCLYRTAIPQRDR